jgi:hypothetical protein
VVGADDRAGQPACLEQELAAGSGLRVGEGDELAGLDEVELLVEAGRTGGDVVAAGDLRLGVLVGALRGDEHDHDQGDRGEHCVVDRQAARPDAPRRVVPRRAHARAV